MNTISKYLIFFVVLFILTLILYVIFVLNNVSSGFLSVVAVLLGSSLTASLTLSLESFRLKKQNREVELAINSEIEYNKIILKRILEDLKLQKEIINTNSKNIKHPMQPIKTDLWDIIKFRIDKRAIGIDYENLIKIVSTIEYINIHLLKRDEYITNNLHSMDSQQYENILNIDETIIINIENSLKILDNLQIIVK